MVWLQKIKKLEENFFTRIKIQGKSGKVKKNFNSLHKLKNQIRIKGIEYCGDILEQLRENSLLENTDEIVLGVSKRTILNFY